MEVNTIAIGCDHAGFPYKKKIMKFLETNNIKILNFGTDSLESVDYPDFVHPVAEAITSKKADLGIIMCGSGNGVAMVANKHQAIRAGLCWTAELAEYTRLHNDANVLAIPVRFISEETALEMVKVFINTEFEGGRHARRVGKIAINC